MAILTFRGAGKRYGSGPGSSGKDWALRPLDLEIASGELAVLVGPSGSGKTTLLRLAAGLERPSSGEVLVDGQRVDLIPAHRRGIAMVSQGESLYPHLTVAQNLAFGLDHKTRDVSEAKVLSAKQADQGRLATRALAGDRQARRDAAWLELDGMLERLPGELSGGERQRVALGRALARNPALFLLDEPFAGLDPGLRRRLLAGFRQQQRAGGATALLVTHDPAGTLEVADRMVVLGQGALCQSGTPGEIVRNPASRFVAELFSSAGLNWIGGLVKTCPAGHCLETPAGKVELPAGKDWTEIAGRQVEMGFSVDAVRVKPAVSHRDRGSAVDGKDGVQEASSTGAEAWIRLPIGAVQQVVDAGERLILSVLAGNAESGQYDTMSWRVALAGDAWKGPVLTERGWLPGPGDQVASAVRLDRALWFDSRTGVSLLKDCG